MFQEPEIKRSNAFGLAEVDKEKGFIELTEEAIRRLKDCRKIFFVMGTGVSGIGKSTKLSQLINPNFNTFNDNQKDFVFEPKDGPDPQTGSERDKISFPSFGPIRLSSFCKRWNIDTTTEDDEIALVFIDSQGTYAMNESGEGLASATAILSAGVGLRLCFAGQGRPSKFNFKEVDGALSMNMIITRQNQQTSGNSFGIIYREIYDTTKEEVSKERKKNDIEKYTNLWIKHNQKLNTPNVFRLWFFENPHKNIKGYWEEMKEVAKWITDLARLKKHNFNSFVEITNAASECLTEMVNDGVEFNDNLDVDMTYNLKNIFYRKLEKIINNMQNFIESTSQNMISTVNDSQILNEDNINQILINQLYQIIEKEFNDQVNLYWTDFKNEFSDIYEYYDKMLHDISKDSIQKNVNIRIESILEKTKEEIYKNQNIIIDESKEKFKEEIQHFSNEQILNPNTLKFQLEKWKGYALNEFENQIHILCKYDIIQNDETITNIIEQSRDKIENEMKFSIQTAINELSNIALMKIHNEKIIQLNEEKKKLEEENKKEIAILQKNQEDQIKNMKEQHTSQIIILEKETNKLNSTINKLKEKQEYLEEQRKIQSEEYENKIKEERKNNKKMMEEIVKDYENKMNDRKTQINQKIEDVQKPLKEEIARLKLMMTRKEKPIPVKSRIVKGSTVTVHPFAKDLNTNETLDEWVYQGHRFTVGQVSGKRAVIYKYPSCQGLPTAAISINDLSLV